MSITSAEGVALAQEFGVSRVVLARELSLDEIRAIRSQTDCELEMFVHGALCVSYSGQCFSSEAWGGRSANRGQCAQACRLPYELIVDGALRPLGDARYLLSPGDLYALHQMPEIVQFGVSALKIEGRYKDADYVALTTAAYRQAVDEAWAGLPLSITRQENCGSSRSTRAGWARISSPARTTRRWCAGVRRATAACWMGKVARVTPDQRRHRTGAGPEAAPLKPGDGVVFDAADWRSPQEKPRRAGASTR
jgi:putative protease